MATLDTSFFGIHEDIILTKNGVWLSNGEEILHQGTIHAFAKNIFRCKDGYEIRLGNEKKTIHVDDTIYFVIGLEGSPEIGFNVTLTDGRTVELNPSRIKYKPGRLTVEVPHPNDQTHEEAKFLSSAYYELLKHLESDADGFTITIEGKKVVLSKPQP
jgi:hypothetical protein